MLIYDRLKSVQIDDKNLPSQIDLGRFYIVDTKEELTNRIINVGSDKIILQELLDNKNKSLQDLFCSFHVSTNAPGPSDFSVVPLIQSVKDKLSLNKFEELLESKILHLEEIFRQPHYVLQRTIEKVNVSRAKRIPAKSYQNLASHTEDWLHKSIVDFKPRRILNEELDLDFDVYENQVAVALIERCLLYLNSRIQEVHDIDDFLVEYGKLLSDRDDASGWYKKIERNLSLIGCVYEDDNYSGKISRKDILSTTQQRLLQMSKRLKALQNSSLFSEVNHRMVMFHMSELDVKPTNVIANHRHYRYVRELWRALNTVDQEKSEAERIQYEQKVIDGVRCYAKAMISYIVKKILNYEIEGTYGKWTASHQHFPSIDFSETDRNLLSLSISGAKIYFLPICNPASFNDSELEKDIYVLSLNCKSSTEQLIRVSPYDADSVERLGRVIKSYILKAYLSKIKEQHEFQHMLKDYIYCISSKEISIQNNYFYMFKGIPQLDLEVSDVLERLSNDDNYNKRSRTDKDNIRSSMESLVGEINFKAKDLAKSIFCFDCLKPIDKFHLKQLDHIVCSCGFALDSSENRVLFHNIESKFSTLREEKWGMDYIAYTIE